jgi:SAM-dependent methyltransferase
MHRPLYTQLVEDYELIEGRDWQREINLIISAMKDCGFRTVIDLGCGTGYHAMALTKLGYEATGIDISAQNIRLARERAEEKNIHARFVVGSYYKYRHPESFDVALCLNWSIPVRDDEVKKFLDNTYSLIRPGGLLIFDFERVSQIVWSDVGKTITESWNQSRRVLVRVSVGRIISNVLYSRDIYIIFSKFSKNLLPSERSRYKAARKSNAVQIYVDTSCVRFFSMSEIRRFASQSGFKVVANFVLPRNRYKRNYAVLKKIT